MLFFIKYTAMEIFYLETILKNELIVLFLCLLKLIGVISDYREQNFLQ